MTRGRGAKVRLQRVGKSFGARSVLRDLTLAIEPGELVTVVGRSGTGKSTLLRLLCGLDAADSGQIRIEDERGRELCDAVRVVFQEPRLLPWRSVLANVAIGRGRGAHARACEVLAQVGLADRALEYPGVLSGGQRQRVALARALVHEPRLLLLDEPFGALDALTRIEAQQLVEALWSRAGYTALLVTHDVEEAVLLGDRVLVMEDGAFVESVSVELPRPRVRALPEVGRLAARLLERVMTKQDSSAEPLPEAHPAPQERREPNASAKGLVHAP